MLGKTALRQLSLPSKLALYMRERCELLEHSTSTSTTSQLRQQLLRLRPYLSSTLARLSDYQLAELSSAVIDTHRQNIAQREMYESYSRTVNADAAALHASGVSKRSTSSGRHANKHVQQRVAKEVSTQEKLRIAELELERAMNGL